MAVFGALFGPRCSCLRWPLCSTDTACSSEAGVDPGICVQNAATTSAPRGKPGHCPLVISIRDALSRDAGRMTLDDAKDFQFETDVAPGSYYLTVGPSDAKDADYWPSNWKLIHIDMLGRLYQMRNAWSKPGPF